MSDNVPGAPFKKGDPRINRNGRPKTFDAARALAQEIAHEVATGDHGDIVIGNHKVTIIEAILRKWATSKDPRLQMAFVEYAYGKPPTRLEHTGEDGKPIEFSMIEVILPPEDSGDNTT